MSRHKADIIIVGGGMVGLAMAAALAPVLQRHQMSLTLIEKSDLTFLENGLTNTALSLEDYDLRVSAISPGNRQFLSSLKAWQRLPGACQTHYQKMQVWDGDGQGRIQFDAAELALADLGTIVENRRLQAALYQTLRHNPHINWICNSEVEAIEYTSQRVTLCLQDRRILSARLVIGADGAGSSIRSLANIKVGQSSYRQTAFVANVMTEKPHQNTAWQRFTQTGPVAFLPLGSAHFCSVVWSLDEEKASRVAQLDSQNFARELAEAFECRLGKVSLIGGFAGFPLVKRHAQSYLAERVVLIGDAAHTIHPLAGQGANLGFQDVACLAGHLSWLADQKRDLGLTANLRRFERERKAENILMQQAMSGFKWFFSTKAMFPTLLRNQFMPILDRSVQAKHLLIQRALGLS